MRLKYVVLKKDSGVLAIEKNRSRGGLVYLVLQVERTMEPIFCRLPSR